jgi:hypothetical protein
MKWILGYGARVSLEFSDVDVQSTVKSQGGGQV